MPGDEARDDVGVEGGHDDLGRVATALQSMDVMGTHKNEITFAKVIGGNFEVMPGPT